MSTPPTPFILHLWHDGDRSVGINGAIATLDLTQSGLERMFDKDKEQYLGFKAALQTLFSDYWDFEVHIASDDELDQADPEPEDYDDA